MTGSSTSSSTYEVLEGLVERINEGGFAIFPRLADGEIANRSRWLNYGDRYQGRRAAAGDRIKVRARGRYVVHLVGESEELPPEPAPRRASAGRSPEEERRALRASSLESAVRWLASYGRRETGDLDRRPTSEDVLTLAEKFERWIYGERGQR